MSEEKENTRINETGFPPEIVNELTRVVTACRDNAFSNCAGFQQIQSKEMTSYYAGMIEAYAIVLREIDHALQVLEVKYPPQPE